MLIGVISFQNKFTWYFGLLYFVLAFVVIFLDFNISPSVNTFLFLDSIENSLKNKTNSITYYLLGLFPFLLYLFLFIILLQILKRNIS